MLLILPVVTPFLYCVEDALCSRHYRSIQNASHHRPENVRNHVILAEAIVPETLDQVNFS